LGGLGWSLYQGLQASGYQVSSREATGIQIGYHPKKFLEINHFSVGLNPSQKILDLIFDFTYYSKGKYSIAISLPYRIDSKTQLIYPVPPGDWNFSNAETGSVLVYVLDVEEDPWIGGWKSHRVGVLLNLKDPVADKIYEVYNVSLPFDGSRTRDVQTEWEKFDVPTIDENYRGSVILAIPPNAVVTGGTHPVKDTHVYPTKEFQALEFEIVDFKPFFFQYILPDERLNVQQNIFLSGVLIGLAISSFLFALKIAVDQLKNKFEEQRFLQTSCV
jgi:hypothetical protein